MKNQVIRITNRLMVLFLVLALLLGGSINPVQAVRSMSSPENPDVEMLVEQTLPILPFKGEHLIVKMKDTRHAIPLGRRDYQYQ